MKPAPEPLPPGAAIGVAGCGAMGRPMAERLLAAGFAVRAFDVRPAEEFDSFARHLAGGVEALRGCDCVISVVRDAAETQRLCLTQQALFRGSRRPPLLVLCSTLPPRYVHELAARLPPGVNLVDAPMSGAPHGARRGELTFMVGGDDAPVRAVWPLLQALGTRQFHLGALGAGMSVKVLNNYVAASSVVATRRAFALAAQLGVEPETLREVMRVSSGANWYAGAFDLIDWAKEGYAPSSTIAILEKDVRAALDLPGLERHALDDALLAGLRALEPLP